VVRFKKGVTERIRVLPKLYYSKEKLVGKRLESLKKGPKGLSSIFEPSTRGGQSFFRGNLACPVTAAYSGVSSCFFLWAEEVKERQRCDLGRKKGGENKGGNPEEMQNGRRTLENKELLNRIRRENRLIAQGNPRTPTLSKAIRMTTELEGFQKHERLRPGGSINC